MTKSIKAFVLAVALMFSMSLFGVRAFALEDNLSGGTQNTSTNSMFGNGSVNADDQAFADWISNHRGMTAENLASATRTLSPLTNIAGNIVGGVFCLIFAWVFVITAFDLLYISIPPLRNILYKGGGLAEGGGAGAGGMMGGGMMGGYGRRGMMGGGMMGGGNPQMQAEQKPIQWISDEAIQCTAMLANGGGGAPAGGMNPMMAGQMAQQQPGANMSMKSVIGMYFKKRIWFMVLLAMSAIVLTSSVLLGTGVNLAMWITKIIDGVNNNIPK